MKVKFGDMTVRQLSEICHNYPDCRECPLNDDAFSLQHKVALADMDTPVEVEIDLPDEEVKHDAEIH